MFKTSTFKLGHINERNFVVGFHPIRPGLLRVPGIGGRGGGVERRVPAANSSKTITDIEIQFGGVVENHKLINLVQDNWNVTSS